MEKAIFISDDLHLSTTEILFPDDLGEEPHYTVIFDKETLEPKTISFDCGACGEQHAEFAELVKCFKEQQAAREIVAVVVA
jgi:hypothetical protein